ncbi:antiterminator Q family protein [Phytobacter diazotrophicus]|uniref:antiterminator Q family protein n=1 Tax=Phytobacter diazotrophicus TaxID=395631 RepID=UPI002936B87F|nr:antiterminator Q family protein [Phytobacter diazotrophicus]MDV2871357.1 antiterminator Q family protein [Phytobacter diazotrophicus]
MRDIQMVLERWGAWAAGGSENIGYPRTAAGLSRLLPASRQGKPSCCDDDGMYINEAMIRLRKHDEYLCSLLEWHYIDNMTLRAMATKLGISHNHVSVRLQAAESFIQGSLCTLEIKLEMDKECRRENILPPKLKRVV